jgi:hypothetical protein
VDYRLPQATSIDDFLPPVYPRPLAHATQSLPMRGMQGLFTSHPNPKYFLFHSSHQIFLRMYVALNIGKKDN